MSAHIRDAADAVIRGLGDYPAALDTLHAHEFLTALETRSTQAVVEFIHEAISESSAGVHLWRHIKANDDTALGETVREIVERYALVTIGNRHLDWAPVGLNECDEHVAADNRERVRAVMEVRRA